MEIGRLLALITADDRDFREKMRRADQIGKQTAKSIGSSFSGLRLSLPKIDIKGMFGDVGALTKGNLIADALRGALTGVGGVMKGAVASGIEYNKMIETGTVRMSRFFTTAQQTDEFVSRLKRFALDSPVFEMPQALTGAQRLLDMKFAAKDVLPMLSNIADAVGGVGGNAETIDRITLALSQMVGNQRISAEEMNQLTEANIPAWELLAKAIGKTEAETRRLVESGRVRGGAAEGIIAMMGEKFAGQSAKAGKTLAGLESQAASAVADRLGKSTEGLFGELKTGYQKVITGLGTEGAKAFSDELDKLLGKEAKKLQATADDIASGKFFSQAAKATATTGQVLNKVETFSKEFIPRPGGLNVFEPETLEDPIDRWFFTNGKKLLQRLGVIGEDASKSFSDGLKQGEGAAKQSGAAVAGAAEQGVRDKLDQHSPSRVMLDLGFDAADSFAKGFEQGKKKIQPITFEDLIKRQFDQADAKGYIDLIEKVARERGKSPALGMGIASRETGLRNIVGDRGRGYGLMQVDIGTDKAFAVSGAWKDAEASIRKGFDVFEEKLQSLIKMAGKEMTIKDRAGQSYKFTVPKLEGEQLTQTALAMYNSGWWAPYHVSKGQSPDFGTTGRDYSADVLRRADIFKGILEGGARSVEKFAGVTTQAIQPMEAFVSSLRQIPAQLQTALPVIRDSIEIVASRGPIPATPSNYLANIGLTPRGEGAAAQPLGGPLPDLPLFNNSAKLLQAAMDALAIKFNEASSRAGKWGNQIDSASKELPDFGKLMQERIGQGFDDMIGALVSGGDNLKQIGVSVITDLLNTMASKFMQQATGFSSIGGFLGNVIGGWLGIGGGKVGGGKAGGGDVRKGMLYPVGEKGMELFAPGMSGTIIPASQTRQMMSASAQQNQTIVITQNFQITAPGGRVMPETQQQIATRAGLAMQAAIQRNS